MPTKEQVLKRKIQDAQAINTNHFATLQRQIDLLLQYVTKK